MAAQRSSAPLPAVSQTIRNEQKADAEGLLLCMLELCLDVVRRVVTERSGVQRLLQEPTQRLRHWLAMLAVPYYETLACRLGMHTQTSEDVGRHHAGGREHETQVPTDKGCFCRNGALTKAGLSKLTGHDPKGCVQA
jgi:hypothetical protein